MFLASSPFRFRWASEASRWLQDGPRGPQEEPKRAPRGPQERPRAPQEGPKSAPRGPFEGPDGGTLFESTLFFDRWPPRWPQEAPRRPQEASKRPPRCPQEAPKRPQDAPPRHPRRSKKPLGQPRGPQDVPRGLQEAPKRHPKRLRRASKRPLALLLVLLSSSFVSSPSSSLVPLPHFLLRFLLHPPLLGYGGIPRPLFFCMLPRFLDPSKSSGHRC